MNILDLTKPLELRDTNQYELVSVHKANANKLISLVQCIYTGDICAHHHGLNGVSRAGKPHLDIITVKEVFWLARVMFEGEVYLSDDRFSTAEEAEEHSKDANDITFIKAVKFVEE